MLFISTSFGGEYDLAHLWNGKISAQLSVYDVLAMLWLADGVGSASRLSRLGDPSKNWFTRFTSFNMPCLFIAFKNSFFFLLGHYSLSLVALFYWPGEPNLMNPDLLPFLIAFHIKSGVSSILMTAFHDDVSWAFCLLNLMLLTLIFLRWVLWDKMVRG